MFILDMVIVFGLCVCFFFVVSTSASDCLERLVSEMTCYVSTGTLNPTHSFTVVCFTASSSSKEGCYVFSSVCLSVCLSVCRSAILLKKL